MKCLIHEWTGLYCPGCGITRACLTLLRGDIYQAFRYNPWVIGTTPIIVFLWILMYKNRRRQLANVMRAYMYLCIVFGIVRNIPWLSFLAPTCVR